MPAANGGRGAAAPAGDTAAAAPQAPGAPPPYGITPYVDRAIKRIQEHLAISTPSHESEAFVVGVFGEWGSGKSTVLNLIGAAFRNKPLPLTVDATASAIRPSVTLKIEFNAWRYEREEHLLVPLLKTIQRTLDAYIQDLEQLAKQETGLAGAAQTIARKATDRKTWSWLLDRAQLLGACTIALTRMVKLKAGIPGLGEVEINPGEALKAAQEQIDRAAKTSRISAERPLESLYYDLYAQLQKLTRGVGEHDQGKLNFLFLVDDLDRCLPEKAVEMLEAIKLFLDVEGCAFVLALDDEVIERGIAHRYRDYLRPFEHAGRADGGDPVAPKPGRYDDRGAPPITGHEYLEKIVQLPFRLPRWSKREVREFLSSRFGDFLQSWSSAPTDPLGQTSAPSTPDPWLLDLMVNAVPPMPRNLVRAVELLDFTRAVAIDRRLGERLQAYPLAQLVLLQLFAPQCFRFLRRGNADGWKTFEKRLLKDNKDFEGSAETIVSHLGKQPSILSEQFFRWWTELCRLRVDEDPYVGNTELPLIRELEIARANRGGFDPRALFLLARDPVARVDDVLEPYFSLFADGTVARPSPAGAPVPAPPSRAQPPVVPSPRPISPQVGAPVEVPVPAPSISVAGPASATAAPQDRDEFLRQLLSPSPEAWRNAIAREDALLGRTLDDRTFTDLVARLKESPPRDVVWLETVAPLLSEIQMRQLIHDTAMLRQWATRALVFPLEPAGEGKAA